MDDRANLVLPVVIIMPADIDVTNASRVGEQLLSALVPGVSAVIVDLTGTAFCDCTGVRSLLLAHSKAAAGDIPFLLVVSPGGVLRILELVGVLHVLRIYSDLAVASAAVTEAAA